MTELTVTSHKPLSRAKRTEIETEFAAKYGDVAVKYVVNDAILGGLVIFDGDKVCDGSVSGRLSEIREAVRRKSE